MEQNRRSLAEMIVSVEGRELQLLMNRLAAPSQSIH